MASDELDIDTSIASLWHAWQEFARGKRTSIAITRFKYNLESNLLQLAQDLQNKNYEHGGYDSFIVHDPKRREIAVAIVRDRVVHRLLYDHLVSIYDKTFCYDAWSCRKDKGLLGAVERTQAQTKKYRHGWIWRSDITKFFDNVDHNILKKVLERKVSSPKALSLLMEVIGSYNCASQSLDLPKARQIHGLPIGNLTSQIFANICLNEFDQFVFHMIKPLGYVRYGDDFVLWLTDQKQAKDVRKIGTSFLQTELKLNINPKHDRIQPTTNKLAYLGVDIWPTGRRLQKRVIKRIDSKINLENSASYHSLSNHHQPKRYHKRLQQNLVDIIDEM